METSRRLGIMSAWWWAETALCMFVPSIYIVSCHSNLYFLSRNHLRLCTGQELQINTVKSRYSWLDCAAYAFLWFFSVFQKRFRRLSLGMLSPTCFCIILKHFNPLKSRSLAGALNGNVGVAKSVIAELSDSTNMAQAFSYIPVNWAIGSTMG